MLFIHDPLSQPPLIPMDADSESKKQIGYNGVWNHQFTPINVVIEKLKDLQNAEKALHHFCRNATIFILLMLYSLQTLDPSKRRGLIDSSTKTFVTTPFEVERMNPVNAFAPQFHESSDVDRVDGFLDIKTENEFWAWSHDVLAASIYNQQLSFDSFNRVLWGIRFRQIRMANSKSNEKGASPSSSSCNPKMIPPIILQANINGLACKYNYDDVVHVSKE